MVELIINKNENIVKITNNIQELLQIDRDIHLSEDLTVIGLDSLKTVELIVNLEDLFSITFEVEELITDNFSTLEKVIGRINSKLEIT